ncbi:MAG: sodium:solute symporter [Chitinophagia bacterium]|nr:sodium:solute symporter [Chitinophagia bacterium]
MRPADWIVLMLTLSGIILYGIARSRRSRDIEGYFLSNREMPWYIVLLSIMGTQASAITFLSAPGQAYTDGMRFVQYYFGLPLAMVVLCISFVPIYHRLRLFTAYEFLETRFDRKTRILTSLIFLVSRALSTGISIYAPSIILSSLLGWDIYLTNIVMGGLLIVYTVNGGARAVAYTQQMILAVVFAGMFLAAFQAVRLLPDGIGFPEAMRISGHLGRLNVITTGFKDGGFDWTDRYNLLSGTIGGFFLALSYFGTDQSQVGRYLTASSLRESRMGLIMNGLVKVPMQFLILLVGTMVFAFYQFHEAPLHFNRVAEERVKSTSYRDSVELLETRHAMLQAEKRTLVHGLGTSVGASGERMRDSTVEALAVLQREEDALRGRMKGYIKAAGASEANDTNYIFLRFVLDHLPAGLVGLLIAVIFLSAWGSIAAALNSLASSTIVDIHRTFAKPGADDARELRISKVYTFLWGVFCILVAELATDMGSLIEAVNILGSWFYGVMLGIFLVAFYARRVGGHAVFYAALIGEALVILLYLGTDMAWLWLNAIGALAVVAVALLLQKILPARN